MTLRVDKRLVRWGHGYGIRLSREEVETKLRARAGSKVRATFEPDTTGPNDVKSLIVLRRGKKAKPYDLYRIIEEDVGR